VDFLVHSSLSDIRLLVMLVVMSSLSESSALMSRCVRSIWNEWNSTSFPGVEWWKRVDDKSMDFLIHSPLSDIWSLMMSVVMSSLVERVYTIVSRWVRAIRNEWHGTSDSGVEWWERVYDETVNFLVHSPLSNIWFLSKESNSIMSRWV
jgi:hypothetical protein